MWRKQTLYCCFLNQESKSQGRRLCNSKFNILNSKLPYLAPSPNNTVFTVRIITIKSIKWTYS